MKLPGAAPDRPNIYDFNTTYDEMYRDLLMKDKNLYPDLSRDNCNRISMHRHVNLCEIKQGICI